MTGLEEQKALREAYNLCLVLKYLLCHNFMDDELYLKAEQLADAIHHYIVSEEETMPETKPTWVVDAAWEITDLIDIGFVCQGRIKNHPVIEAIIDKHRPPEEKVARNLWETLRGIGFGQCCGTPGCDIDNPCCDVMEARAACHLVVLARYKAKETSDVR